MNKRARWARRVLRDHRRAARTGAERPWMHAQKLVTFADVDASLWGWWGCARCPQARVDVASEVSGNELTEHVTAASWELVQGELRVGEPVHHRWEDVKAGLRARHGLPPAADERGESG